MRSVHTLFHLDQTSTADNCQETVVAPFTRSGIYKINPKKRGEIDVICEISEDGRGNAMLFSKYLFRSKLQWTQPRTRKWSRNLF